MAEEVKTPPAPAAEPEKKPETPPPAADPKKDSATPPVKEEPKKEEQPPAKVVPEKYDLKVGEDSVLDPIAVEKIAAYAKEQGLSQEEAQQVLDGEAEAVAKDVSTRSEAWLTAAKADKEIGGEAFEKNKTLALQVVEKFFTPEFQKLLNRSGYGNNPEVLRGFARLGKAMSPDKLVNPTHNATGPTKSREEKFYPEMKKA